MPYSFESNYYLAAFLIGITCGFKCSPIIFFFLSSYITGHDKNIKNAINSSFFFISGKVFAIVTLSIISSLIGKSIVSESHNILNIDTSLILDFTLITFGVYIILSIIINRNKIKNCSCKNTNQHKSRKGLFIVGFFYGASPCIPLITILIVSSLIPIWSAIIVSLIFGISSAFVPIGFVTLISGFFSKKIYSEIPENIYIFKIIMSCILIIIGLLSFYSHSL